MSNLTKKELQAIAVVGKSKREEKNQQEAEQKKQKRIEDKKLAQDYFAELEKKLPQLLKDAAFNGYTNVRACDFRYDQEQLALDVYDLVYKWCNDCGFKCRIINERIQISDDGVYTDISIIFIEDFA